MADVKQDDVPEVSQEGIDEIEADEVEDEDQEPKAVPKSKASEPQKGNPRWNEIYEKNKFMERQLAQQREEVSAMKAHNIKITEAMKGMAGTVNEINTKISDTERPDPIESPDEFADWLENRIAKKMNKTDIPQYADIPAATMSGTDTAKQAQFSVQEQVESSIHDDYFEVMEIVNKDINRDPVLRNEIWGANNPARAAYSYGKKRLDKNTAERTAIESQGYVEPAAGISIGDKRTLSREEKAQANILLSEYFGGDAKKAEAAYLQQVLAIEAKPKMRQGKQ